MINALTYLTRKCPRRCSYCAIRNSKVFNRELSIAEWIDAFSILKSVNTNFNLILGNETWLYGKKLLSLFEHNQVPYALYTTAPKELFTRFRKPLLQSEIIDNFSGGIDYPPPYSKIGYYDDSINKSKDVWEAFLWIKKNFPNLDTQGTVTINKSNFLYLPKLVKNLSDLGVFIGVNFIHWNIDGGYDFFPDEKAISSLLFSDKDWKDLRETLDMTLRQPGLLQNPEMLKLDVTTLTSMGWHCNGDPYGGPTIDADGSLRVCGYRKGIRTPKFSIFDLPKYWDNWKEAVYKDAMDCPGCIWSYPWMYQYWERHNEELGKNVFIKHAGEHIPESKWSKRNL